MLSSCHKRTISVLAGLALVATACVGEPSSGPDVSGVADEQVVEVPFADAVSDAHEFIQRELTTGPAVAIGPHGTADASAYLQVTAHNLSTLPEVVDGTPIQQRDYSFYTIREAEHLVSGARLAIRGEVVEFGLPRFNSDTGGFWTPSLHEEPGVVDIANEVWREVQIRVTDVLGDVLDTGVQPGDTVVFISRGGQIRVELADVADADGNRAVPEGEHPHKVAPSDSFVVQSPPPIDLTKGEDIIVLLDWNKFKGLYGGSYGYRYELMPTNETLYKYVIEGDTAINVGDPDGPLTMDLDTFQKLIDSSIGTAAGELPRPGVFAAEPHPPVDPNEGSPPDDVPVPDHTHGE